MSRNQRLALLLATLLAAAGLFLILKPEDEDPERTAATTTETEPAETSPGDTVAETAPGETQVDPEGPEVEQIDVEGGEPVGGVRRIEVTKGERVRFEVAVDEAAEIHLHGYDVFEDATPERVARFDLRADLEGIFEIEIEGTHVQIAELRVEP